ncbi:MAG: phosphatidylglycerophosphatase A [Acidobacteriaceae bacterium]|nr:phosphatidylglycerophosphatase A [Acidobacteriaceae bacterium]MBV8569365.1 phosphatidylglycerophosphatase A [Acidobacteriaceae bacterium]
MNRLALVIATWFGCGYFPIGPGTVGSLAAALIAAGLHVYFNAGRLTLLLLVILLTLPAIWAATRTARQVQKQDPGIVVIDEVLGQWVTLLGAPLAGWKVFVAAFFLFRIFDIWKPGPVRKLERLPDGTGIVADDLAAGLCGALILYIGGRFRLY